MPYLFMFKILNMTHQRLACVISVIHTQWRGKLKIFPRQIIDITSIHSPTIGETKVLGWWGVQKKFLSRL